MLSIPPCVPLFLSASSSSALLIHGSGHACATHSICTSMCTALGMWERAGERSKGSRSRTALPIPAGPSSMNKDIIGTPCTAAAGATFRLIYHSTRSIVIRVTARDVCVSVKGEPVDSVSEMGPKMHTYARVRQCAECDDCRSKDRG